MRGSLPIALSGLLALFCSMPAATAQESFHNLGPCDETIVLGPGEDACSSGTLVHHHVGACDDGVCWQFAGIVPPDYGAFAEAYDLGPGTVHCGAFWLTAVGDYAGLPSDLYIWQGGVSGSPGSVIAMIG